MNSGPLLFLGVLFTLATSFWGLLLMPHLKLGQQPAVTIPATGELYPTARPGTAREGADVYRSLGCVECHTQQVRARGFGTDFQRGWGLRFTVAQDYLRDQPVLLGSQRVGPDLANIGVRQTNAVWHLVHLYDPELTSPGSMMPPYRFLFEPRKLKPGASPSPDALPVHSPEGTETVAKPDAHALVAYLLSLRVTAPLFESPLPGSATNAAVGATNQPAADTNAPAAGTNAPAATVNTSAPPGSPVPISPPAATNAPPSAPSK